MVYSPDAYLALLHIFVYALWVPAVRSYTSKMNKQAKKRHEPPVENKAFLQGGNSNSLFHENREKRFVKKSQSLLVNLTQLPFFGTLSGS